MNDEAWPKVEFLDLVCDECGWQCNSNIECLVHGDRCPKCEESRPGEEGTMKEIEDD
jgi:hypothetical protein